MDPTILTPRLKLILLTKAERDSSELGWLHELHSNEQTTWWSIHGQSKSAEQTAKIATNYLPKPDGSGYRIVYAVHVLPTASSNAAAAESHDPSQPPSSSQFIGLVTLISLDGGGLPLPEELTLPATATATTLSTVVAYQFLPNAWGKGYATEALNAVFDASRRAPAYWSPYSAVHVRAIVNDGNPASQRVMAKTGMVRRGIYEWTGKPIFLAGEWRERENLHIFGMDLLQQGAAESTEEL